MSLFMSSLGPLGLLILPALVGQWIGVIGLRKSAGRGSWWCMLLGTSMISLGTVAAVFTAILGAIPGIREHSESYVITLMILFSILSLLGPLLFAIGFAIHGCRSGRMSERITELEMLSLAQATELERLRNR